MTKARFIYMKLFSSQFEFRLPKLDSKIFNIYYSSVLGITISLHHWFCCPRNEREISHWKAVMDWRWRVFCISTAYCQMFERGELWKQLFQLCSHKDKEAYMFKEAAGYGKEKRAKISFFKKKNSTLICCRFEPLMYFTFWIIPWVSEFSL